jgi:hypothetical protein
VPYFDNIRPRKKEKSYTEAELIDMFQLNRIIDTPTTSMIHWLNTPKIALNVGESFLFDTVFEGVKRDISAWSEEDLKMKFISPILLLGNLRDNGRFRTFFEKTLSGEVQGYCLKTKTDFMVASGILNLPKNPYFHFQEYKPELNPTGEPMAQLLEAMLIAQSINHNEKCIYGCEIIGKNWNFVILEGKSYCISDTFDCTKKDELLQIIAILRKFRHILETELLD